MTETPKKEGILVAKWRLLLTATADPKLTKSDIAVLASVLDRINPRSKIAFPSRTKIAQDSAISLSSVKRSIEILENLNYLSKKSGDRVNANTYRMGSPRFTAEPRATDEPRFTAEPEVGSCVNFEVGSQVSPQSGKSSNQEKELKKRVHTPLAPPDEKSGQNGTKAKTLQEWINSLPAGKNIVENDDEIYSYASTVEMPRDMLFIAWRYFDNRFSNNEERQPDWRSYFRRSVRECWSRAWILQDDEYQLTTVGKQLKRQVENALKRTLNVY